MKCTAPSCPCLKYLPGEDVYEEWKRQLTEKDWDAMYFDSSELCDRCGHAPECHAPRQHNETDEATVISALHIASHLNPTTTSDTLHTDVSVATPHGTHAVRILHKNESTFSDVGLQLWRCSLLLTDYITSMQDESGVVWELGAGVALPSLLLSKLGVRSWASDSQSSVLRNLEAEVEENGSPHIEVKRFDFAWGSREVAVRQGEDGWKQEDLACKVRCLIAADVIFDNDVTDQFLGFLTAHLHGALVNPLNASICYVAYDRRSGQIMTDSEPPVEHFLNSIPTHGLHSVKIPSEDIPLCCRGFERSPDVALVQITLMGDAP